MFELRHARSNEAEAAIEEAKALQLKKNPAAEAIRDVSSRLVRYWGKLVMELVYGYLDPDVAKWLKENAPKPMHGQNYHQWLSSQYGLKKLMEHLWMLIGLASACQNMPELRQRMAEKYGREYVQLSLYLPTAQI